MIGPLIALAAGLVILADSEPVPPGPYSFTNPHDPSAFTWVYPNADGRSAVIVRPFDTPIWEPDLGGYPDGHHGGGYGGGYEGSRVPIWGNP